jgi:hypothetical protein
VGKKYARSVLLVHCLSLSDCGSTGVCFGGTAPQELHSVIALWMLPMSKNPLISQRCLFIFCIHLSTTWLLKLMRIHDCWKFDYGAILIFWNIWIWCNNSVLLRSVSNGSVFFYSAFSLCYQCMSHAKWNNYKILTPRADSANPSRACYFSCLKWADDVSLLGARTCIFSLLIAAAWVFEINVIGLACIFDCWIYPSGVWYDLTYWYNFLHLTKFVSDFHTKFSLNLRHLLRFV